MLSFHQLGVILYILLSGKAPFADGPHLIDNVRAGKYSFPKRHWTGISDAAQHLVKCLLTKQPSQRITIDQVYQHPWMLGAQEVPPNWSHLNLALPAQAQNNGVRLADAPKPIAQPIPIPLPPLSQEDGLQHSQLSQSMQQLEAFVPPISAVVPGPRATPAPLSNHKRKLEPGQQLFGATPSKKLQLTPHASPATLRVLHQTTIAHNRP